MKELNTLADTQAAYLAGLVDGEAALIIYKHKNKSQRGYCWNSVLNIAMCDENTIRMVAGWLGAAVCKRMGKLNGIETRPLWTLSLYGRNMLPVINQIRPYLITKRRQAELLLQASKLLKGGVKKVGEQDIIDNKMVVLQMQMRSLAMKSPRYMRGR